MNALILLLVAPNTVLEDVQEIQPWCRITATTSQSHNENSTNVPFVGGGSRWRWAGGPEQCSAVFANMLELSGCSGGSPGALYLNNIILIISYYS